MKLLEGKKGLVLGVLNEKSIAWGIAKDLFENGAEMALTYLGEAGEKRVVPMAQQINCNITIPCNVSSDEDINNVFKVVEEKFGKLDFLIHAIAFSDKNELRGDFVNTTRENFKNTLDISCYSLIALNLNQFAKSILEGVFKIAIFIVLYQMDKNTILYFVFENIILN